MGFKSVYRTLQEIFPQVDARLLKAAAIEHSKDPNGAVEFILAEFLPFTTKPYVTSSSSIVSPGCPSSVENERRCVAQLVPSSPTGGSKHAPSFPGVKAIESAEMNDTYHVDPACLIAAHDSLNSTFCNRKNIKVQSNENTVEAASRDINDELSGKSETIHGLLDPGCEPRDTNDELSGKSEKATNSSADMNVLLPIGPSSLPETPHASLCSTFCERMEIDDHLIGATGIIESIASRVLNEKSTEGVEDVSCNISVSHAYEEVYDGHKNQNVQNNSLEDTLLRKFKDMYLPDVIYSSSSAAVAAPDVLLNNKQEISHFCRDLNGSILVHGEKKSSRAAVNSTYGSNYVELASLPVEDHTQESSDCSIQSEVHNSLSSSNVDILKINTGGSREDIHFSDSVNIKESSNMHTVAARSDQLCRTNLENLIANSKTHKGTLLSAMDSVLKLMREVEFEEKVAQQVKEEAAKGGLEILARVDELKMMLKDVREANDMHSGEVYGERAILATEMRELQSRLSVLSDEKDKSVSLLDTMLKALEIRLAAAEAEKFVAEQEKLGKDESARKALAELELVMQMAVQESKLLQHEAEQNAKLREFLADRGRVVDTLQGEISVICQDVKLLKENFDSHVPLSQCLSPKQTSCMVASSGSSLKSSGSQQALEQAEWSSLDDLVLPSMVQVATSDQDELVDEGWELFDHNAA